MMTFRGLLSSAWRMAIAGILVSSGVYAQSLEASHAAKEAVDEDVVAEHLTHPSDQAICPEDPQADLLIIQDVAQGKRCLKNIIKKITYYYAKYRDSQNLAYRDSSGRISLRNAHWLSEFRSPRQYAHQHQRANSFNEKDTLDPVQRAQFVQNLRVVLTPQERAFLALTMTAYGHDGLLEENGLQSMEERMNQAFDLVAGSDGSANVGDLFNYLVDGPGSLFHSNIKKMPHMIRGMALAVETPDYQKADNRWARGFENALQAYVNTVHARVAPESLMDSPEPLEETTESSMVLKTSDDGHPTLFGTVTHKVKGLGKKSVELAKKVVVDVPVAVTKAVVTAPVKVVKKISSHSDQSEERNSSEENSDHQMPADEDHSVVAAKTPVLQIEIHQSGEMAGIPKIESLEQGKHYAREIMEKLKRAADADFARDQAEYPAKKAAFQKAMSEYRQQRARGRKVLKPQEPVKPFHWLTTARKASKLSVTQRNAFVGGLDRNLSPAEKVFISSILLGVGEVGGIHSPCKEAKDCVYNAKGIANGIGTFKTVYNRAKSPLYGLGSAFLNASADTHASLPNRMYSATVKPWQFSPWNAGGKKNQAAIQRMLGWLNDSLASGDAELSKKATGQGAERMILAFAEFSAGNVDYSEFDYRKGNLIYPVLYFSAPGYKLNGVPMGSKKKNLTFGELTLGKLVTASPSGHNYAHSKYMAAQVK